MAQYSAADGVVGDYHLVHLGARSGRCRQLEMVDDQPHARRPHHAWPPGFVERRAAGRVSALSISCTARPVPPSACSGPQRSGGLTQLGWEDDRARVRARASRCPKALPLLAASAIPYGLQNQTPRPLPAGMEMAALKDAFVDSTRAAAAGLDCWSCIAHGYPLLVVHQPAQQPPHRMSRRHAGELLPLAAGSVHRHACGLAGGSAESVRISAHDWVEGGITPDDAQWPSRACSARHAT